MGIKSIHTEKFKNLPVSTRCLYFELFHTANKKHICITAGTVLKSGNYAQDDLVFLIERGFAKIVREGIALKI